MSSSTDQLTSCCPCIILQECTSLHSMYEVAFAEYKISRGSFSSSPNLSEPARHCGEIVGVLPPKQKQGPHQEDEDDEDDSNSKVATLAKCVCKTLFNDTLLQSTNTKTPTQFLVPLLLWNHFQSQQQQSSSSSSFTAIQYYDAAASLYHPPSSTSASTMNQPFVVLVHTRHFAQYLYDRCISHQLRTVCEKLRKEQQQHADDVNKDDNIVVRKSCCDDDNDEECCCGGYDYDDVQNDFAGLADGIEEIATEENVVDELAKSIIPGMLEGLRRASSSSSSSASSPSSPFRELLLNVAPCSASHLSEKHVNLPGGLFECFGPSLLWQVMCCMNVLALSLAAGGNGEDMRFILQRTGVLRKSSPVGRLVDDVELLQKAEDLLLDESLPSFFGIIAMERENEEVLIEGMKSWFSCGSSIKTKDRNNDDDDDDDDDEENEDADDQPLHPLCISLLLNCRITQGSTTASSRGALPRPPNDLIQSFCQRHADDQIFSVGARALAKHNHRDETQNWWNQGTGGATVLKGTQAEKNKAALIVLYDKILNDIAWCNCHMLPHDIVTMEIRCSAGYGVRWTAATAAPLKEANASNNNDDDENENEHRDTAAAGAATRGKDDDEYSFVPSNILYVERTTIQQQKVVINTSTTPERDPAASATRVAEFRGFLEPHDEDGHAKGWKH